MKKATSAGAPNRRIWGFAAVLLAMADGAAALTTEKANPPDGSALVCSLTPSNRQLAAPAFPDSCKASLSQFELPPYGSLFAQKRVMDREGDLRGPIYSTIRTPPATLPNYAFSPQRAFNADFSHVPLAIETNVLDDALGDPAKMNPPAKYHVSRTAASIYIRALNTASVNNANGHGENRTGYGSIVIDFNNASHHADPAKIGGDMSPLLFSGFASTARPAATSFRGNPAITGVAGQLKAGTDGVFMEPYGDLNCIDGGFDAACLSVINLQRDNATGALNTNFVGSRVQSIGRKPIDAFFSAVGPGVTGLDLTNANSPDHVMMQKPAIVAKGRGYRVGDRLAFEGACDQPPTVEVAAVDAGGGVAEINVERRGMCSSFPKSPAAGAGGHGAGAAFDLDEAPQVAMQMSRDSYIFGDATCDRKVFGACFPSTTTPGSSYFGYSAPLRAWNLVASGSSSLQVAKSSVTVEPMLVTKGAVTAAVRVVAQGAEDAVDSSGAETDYVVVWRARGSGQRTERLPACTAANKGRVLVIKDGGGEAASRPIVIRPASGTIEGDATYVIATNRAALQLQCDGDAQDWVKIN